MIFEYFKKTGELYDKNGEWDGDDGFEFDYEVDDKEILDAVCKIVDEYYFEGKLNRRNFKNFVRDFDLFEELVEVFKDELKDYFKEDAFARF